MRDGKTKKFLLKPSTPEDHIFLFHLFNDVRAPEFALSGLQEPALTHLMTMQHRAQSGSYAAQFPDAEDSIIWTGAERVGRMLVARRKSEMHLVDIALLSAYRGQGIGTVLLQSLCDEAHAANVPLRLSVRAGNPAERLYRRMGFVRMGGDGMNFTMEFGGAGGADAAAEPLCLNP